MRKGFTRNPRPDEPATQRKNYITPGGIQRLKDEHRFLLTRERRAVKEVVASAASNGYRSENADHQYGKRRLRQIDGRIRFSPGEFEAARPANMTPTSRGRPFLVWKSIDPPARAGPKRLSISSIDSQARSDFTCFRERSA